MVLFRGVFHSLVVYYLRINIAYVFVALYNLCLHAVFTHLMTDMNYFNINIRYACGVTKISSSELERHSSCRIPRRGGGVTGITKK